MYFETRLCSIYTTNRMAISHKEWYCGNNSHERIEDPVVLEIIKEVLQWRRNFSARVVLCSKSAKKNQFYYINVVCINLCSEFWTLGNLNSEQGDLKKNLCPGCCTDVVG